MGCELGKLASSSSGNKKDLENGNVSEPAAPAPPDPRLPFTARQKYTMVASWKGISRALETTGVNLFIKWTDLWLNEGLATLYEYYVPHLLYPDDGYMESFRKRELHRCFNVDVASNPISVPLSHYVESPKDIENRFDDISYSKGGVVMRMFQEAYTVPTFTKGLNIYLNSMAFKAATPTDLMRSIEIAYREDNNNQQAFVMYVMGTWIYQAGYPIVSVSLEGDKFVFKQRRYPSGNELYAIPMTYTTRHDVNFEAKNVKFYLFDESMEVNQDSLTHENDDWIIFNIQQVGYYRMTYSDNIWHMIATGLLENHNAIHQINREVLIEELEIGYSKLNELQASTLLEVLFYLREENSSDVWDRADRILDLLNSALFGTDVYDNFLKYLQHISSVQLQSLGLQELDGEPMEKVILRTIVKHRNCLGLGDLCMEYESKRLEMYMQDSENNPPPDFCSAFRFVKIQTYLLFLNKIISESNVQHRYWIVGGITCSLIRTNLQVLIYMIEDSNNKLTDYEREIIIENLLLSSKVGLEVGFEYLERNYDKISPFITCLKLAVNTQEYSEKLDKLLGMAIAEDFITQEKVDDIRDTIKLNLKWQERHYEDVRNWLENFDDRTLTTEKPVTEYTTPDNSSVGLFGSFYFISISFIFMRIIS